MYDRASWTSQDDLKHNSDSLYEKKIISNRDFPVEILIKRSSNLTEKKAIFGLHWHEHIELHYIISGVLEGTLDRRPYMVREGTWRSLMAMYFIPVFVPARSLRL